MEMVINIKKGGEDAMREIFRLGVRTFGTIVEPLPPPLLLLGLASQQRQSLTKRGRLETKAKALAASNGKHLWGECLTCGSGRAWHPVMEKLGRAARLDRWRSGLRAHVRCVQPDAAMHFA